MPETATLNLNELREARVKAVTEARKILDKASAEKREPNAEERASYDKAMKNQGRLKDEIAEGEKREASVKELETAEREMGESRGRRVTATDPGRDMPEDPDAPLWLDMKAGTISREDPKDLGGMEYRNCIKLDPRITGTWQGHGPAAYHRRADPLYRNAFRSYLAGGEIGGAFSKYREKRDPTGSFANDDVTAGGYLHPPIMFNAYLIKKLNNLVYIRQRATVFPVVNSDTLGTPQLSTEFADPSWTAELGTNTADTSAVFGRRDIQPHLLSKLVTISRKLLMTAVLNPETIVAERLAYHFSITEEQGYLTGNGSAPNPLGVYTASANGVNTDRDIAVGTAGAGGSGITFDGLQDVKHHLKAQYRKNANWNMHRSVVNAVSKIKDLYGRYIWEPSGQAGSPDKLLGFPVDESEYAPNVTTIDGSYVCVLGDFSSYWIADLFGFEIQRLNEAFAVNNQVGFIARRYTDGAPVQNEAFSRGVITSGTQGTVV